MVCPKGHESEDSDFCSVCGAKMVGALAPSADKTKCPDCGAARQPEDTVFCEECGYNFTSGEHGEPKPAPPAVVAEWELSISIDPSLKTPESPDPPPGFQPSAMMLLGDSYLIGRRSEKRGIVPEISLDADDAVSHRHALLTRTSDGGFSLRDLGSSNGTRLNGADLPAMADTPLQDGDAITVGHWSRIAIRRVG